MKSSIRAVVVLSAFALGTASPALRSEPAAEPAEPVSAAWVEVQRTLFYVGRTTYYSCDGLRDKTRYILKQAGARDDLKVTISCLESSGGGVESMPSVRIKAAFPAEATPELRAKLATEAPKRELLARVTGTGDAADVEFPAVWRRVVLDGRGRGRIEDGDCELLELLLEQVLIPAGARVAPGSRLNCVPNQVPIGSVRLVIDTLHKAPEPDAVQADPPQ
jgi:hypothetical protein